MTFPTPIAFSPGSITCFFSPNLGVSASTSYSRGCAINIDKGVTAGIQPSVSNITLLNGVRTNIGAVEAVISALAPEPITLHFETPLKLGFGFGVSAACCLTAVFAIAKRYGLPHSRTELGLIAHQAEVQSKTGLGDVAAQLCGGLVFRRCLTGPLDTEKVNIDSAKLYYQAFGELNTAEVLGSSQQLALIAKSGAEAVHWLKQHTQTKNAPSLAEILARSRQFADECHLISDDRVNKTIKSVLVEGGQATMIMLGQGVLSTHPAQTPSLWTECTIDEKGARWL